MDHGKWQRKPPLLENQLFLQKTVRGRLTALFPSAITHVQIARSHQRRAPLSFSPLLQKQLVADNRAFLCFQRKDYELYFSFRLCDICHAYCLVDNISNPRFCSQQDLLRPLTSCSSWLFPYKKARYALFHPFIVAVNLRFTAHCQVNLYSRSLSIFPLILPPNSSRFTFSLYFYHSNRTLHFNSLFYILSLFSPPISTISFSFFVHFLILLFLLNQFLF